MQENGRMPPRHIQVVGLSDFVWMRGGRERKKAMMVSKCPVWVSGVGVVSLSRRGRRIGWGFK